MTGVPGLYTITFLPDGHPKDFAGSRGNYYELPDGTHVDLRSEPVWCHACAKVTHGEEIEPLAEIEKLVADLRDPSSEAYRSIMRATDPLLDGLLPRDKFRRSRLEDLDRRRRWRALRVAPPKCIRCGSTDILQLPVGTPVAIPGTGRTVLVHIRGMCSTDFNEWFFTVDGDRIPRDTKPTYWHLPGEGRARRGRGS
ncbi:MAG TPA: hypothetical protein VF796_22350 [Humisphaera sp.]